MFVLKHPAIRRFIYSTFDRYKPNAEYKIASLNSDYINKEIFSNGIYESSLLEKLKGIIVKEETFGTYVDVGANIGNHTVYFSKIAKEVIAFEPNPICYNLTKANLLANKCNNAIVINKAVSSKIGNARFVFNFEHTGGGNLLDSSIISDDEEIDVKLTILDEFYSKIEKLDLIKIDAEGHENDVLLGAKKIIIRDLPIVVYEAHGLDALKKVSKTLQKYGYNQFCEIVQSRRYFKWKLLNYLAYLLFPNAAKIVDITFDDDKNYQMVVAKVQV